MHLSIVMFRRSGSCARVVVCIAVMCFSTVAASPPHCPICVSDTASQNGLGKRNMTLDAAGTTRVFQTNST